MTMTLISTATVGAGGAASIDFSSIPQDATDLLVFTSCRGQATQTAMLFRFNSDSSSIYDERRLEGDGAVVSTTSAINATYIRVYSTGTSQTTNTFSNSFTYVANYTSSNQKVVNVDSIQENNGAASALLINAGLYKSTSAITSINIGLTGGFAQNSTASLYKITKGSDGITVVT